jgi:hypothetical protein
VGSCASWALLSETEALVPELPPATLAEVRATEATLRAESAALSDEIGGIDEAIGTMLTKVRNSVDEINATTAENVGTIADRLHDASGTLGDMCHHVPPARVELAVS